MFIKTDSCGDDQTPVLHCRRGDGGAAGRGGTTQTLRYSSKFIVLHFIEVIHNFTPRMLCKGKYRKFYETDVSQTFSNHQTATRVRDYKHKSKIRGPNKDLPINNYNLL